MGHFTCSMMGKAESEDRPASGGEEADALSEQVQNLSIEDSQRQEPAQTPQPQQSEEASLVSQLHARLQLSERVHTAVVQDHTNEGFVLDVIIFDNSDQEPLSHPQSHKHEALIPQNSS